MSGYPLRFFVVTVMFACFALAQSSPVQGIEPRTAPPAAIQVQPQATQPNIAVTPEKEIEALKKKIAKLQEENKQLADENYKLKEQNNNLNKQIADMTKKGGSQVKAYCESPTISKNTAGASSNCASSGYTCDPVSGLCYSRCANSEHCAPGYACDSGNCASVSGR